MKKVLKHLNKVYEGVTVELKTGGFGYQAMVFVDGETVMTVDSTSWKELKSVLRSEELKAVIDFTVFKVGIIADQSFKKFLKQL